MSMDEPTIPGMANLTIAGNAEICFPFPELHRLADQSVSILRFWRFPPAIPLRDHYPFNDPGAGFALRPVDDFADRLPPEMLDRGGVIIPMWQSEGLRIQSRNGPTPFLVRAAAGTIDAMTGQPAIRGLSLAPRNYFRATPLDGIDEPGNFRQFVAPVPDPSRSLEDRLLQSAAMALRISVHPKRIRWEHYFALISVDPRPHDHAIVDDPNSPDWVIEGAKVLYANLVDATTWRDLTGDWPGHRPHIAADYGRCVYPWSADYAEPTIPAGILEQLRLQPPLVTDSRSSGVPPVTLRVRLATF